MKEILDIVNQNDEVIGKDSRKKIYEEGLPNNNYIRYVNILVFDLDGKLLLPLRNANENIFPNCYDFSCGEHLKSGEQYNEAANRGIFEELGLQNVNLKLLGKLSPKEKVSGFMQIYKLVITSKDLQHTNEAQSLHWHKIEEVFKMIKNYPAKFKDDLLIVLNWYQSNFT